jgi:hypothetical protein
LCQNKIYNKNGGVVKMTYFLSFIGLILIVVNMKALRKKESSFENILEQEKIDITQVDIIRGELKIEFSKTVLELQSEILELKEKINSSDKIEKIDSDLIETSKGPIDDKEIVDSSTPPQSSYSIYNREYEIKKDATDIKKDKNNTKLEEIRQLLNQGFSVDEINERTQMGKGEILLIKKLYLK